MSNGNASKLASLSGAANPPAADATPGVTPATLGDDGEQAVSENREQLMTIRLNCLKLIGNLTICTSSNNRNTDLKMLSGDCSVSYINNVHRLFEL